MADDVEEYGGEMDAQPHYGAGAWSEIELLGGSEYTVVGPQRGGPVYRSELMCLVSPTHVAEIGNGAPYAFATASSHGVCLIVESHVHVCDPTCSTALATIALECRGEIACWSNEGSLLVIGDCQGTAHFVDLQTTTILFSQQLGVPAHGQKAFASMAFVPQDGGKETLYVQMGRGGLMRFSNIDVREARAAIDQGDMARAAKVKERIQMTHTDAGTLHGGRVADMSVGFARGRQVIATVGSGTLCTWTAQEGGELRLTGMVRHASYGDVTKSHLTTDGKALLTMHGDSALCMWDAATLVMIHRWEIAGIEDFAVIPGAQCQGLRIAVGFKPGNEADTGKRRVTVSRLPKMTPVYSLTLPRHSRLVANSSITDTFFAVEAHDDPASGCTTEVGLRQLNEAQPKALYYHMLAKHRFEEAEAYAALHGMDTKLLVTTQADAMLHAVNQGLASVALLVQCLERIDDPAYVVDFCLNAELPRLQDVQQLLSHAAKRASTEPELAAQVVQARHLLGTFALVLSSDEAFDALEWQRFRTSSLELEISKRFTSGRAQAAISIWRRHQFNEMVSGSVRDIIGSIQEQTPSQVYSEWLCAEVMPGVSSPADRDWLANWAEQRARALELCEKHSWPANALSLGDGMLRSAWDVSWRAHSTTPQLATAALQCFATLPAAAQTSNEVADDAWGRLAKLRNDLLELQHLGTVLGLRLSLSQFAQETPESIAVMLMDRVHAAELLPETIADRVRPYIEKKKLDCDTVLSRYCISVLRAGEASAEYAAAGSLSEARSLAVLSTMSCAPKKAEVVIELMRVTPIPCSQAVADVIQAAREWDPRVQSSFQWFELRTIAAKYGVANFAVSDTRMAQGLMMRIARDTRNSGAVEDALKLAAAYTHMDITDVYVARLQFLCEDNLLGDADALYASLADGRASHVGLKVLAWVLVGLEDAPVLPEDAALRLNRLVLALLVLRRLAHKDPDMAAMQETITRIMRLQEQFGIFISYEDYLVEANRMELLNRHLDAFAGRSHAGALPQEGKKKQSGNAPTQAELSRLAELLGVDRNRLRTLIAVSAAKRGEASRAFMLCRELFSKDADQVTARTLLSVVQILSTRNADEPLSDEDQEQLRLWATRGVTTCAPADIAVAMELFRVVDLMSTVRRECSVRPYYARGMPAGAEPSQRCANADDHQNRFAREIFSDRYNEVGFVLSEELAMPMAGEIASLVFPSEFPAWPAPLPDVCSRLGGVSDITGATPGGKARRAANTAFSSLGVPPAFADLVHATEDMAEYLEQNCLYMDALRFQLHTLGLWLRVMSLRLASGDGKSAARVSSCFDEHFTTSLSRLALTLATNVLRHQPLDHGLAVGYMLTIDNETAFENFKTALAAVGGNYARLEAIADMGMTLARQWQQRPFMLDCKTLGSHARWWHKLQQLGVQFDERLFRQCKDGTYQRRLLPELLRMTSLDLSVTLDFCAAYHVPRQAAVQLYIELLLFARPVSDTTEYQGKITAVLGEFEAQTALSLMAEAWLPQVSPYDYECMHFLLQHMRSLDPRLPVVPRALRLWQILRRYQRHAPPRPALATCGLPALLNSTDVGEKSCAAVEEQFVESQCRDAAGGKYGKDHTMLLEEMHRLHSATRLPFHLVLSQSDGFSILRSELTADTVETLLPVAALLDMKKERFVLAAIEHATRSAGHGFAAVEKLMGLVEDVDVAVMTLEAVAERYPVGADRVAAYAAAQRRLSAVSMEGASESKKAAMEEHRARVAQKLSAATTKHQLQELKITDRDLHDLIGQPLQLICHLYRDYGPRMLDAGDKRLHEVVESIAARSELDLARIRQYLVQLWLGTPHVDNPPDAKVQTAEWELQQEALGIKRIIYVCQATVPREDCLAYLLDYASTHRSAKVTYAARVRAMRTLLGLARPGEIEDIQGSHPHELRSTLESLLYAAQFEKLHINQSLQTLNECNKDGMIRSLWRNYGHDPNAIKLITELCLEYAFFDATLWGPVVQRLQQLPDMHAFLAAVLPYIDTLPQLAHMRGVLDQAWWSLLTSGGVGEKEKRSLMVQCPTLEEFDLQDLLRRYLAQGDTALAAYLVITTSRFPGFQALVQTMIEHGYGVHVLDAARDADGDGAQREVFRQINALKRFDTLAGTPHFVELAQFLVREDAVQDLIAFLLQQDRLGDAAELVVFYNAQRGLESGGAVKATLASADTMEQLQLFMEQKGLSDLFPTAMCGD